MRLRLLGSGMLVGMADALPGISGGTVAYLTGIHARLVGALAFLTDRIPLRQKLGHERFAFLVVVGVGIVAGILVGANLLVRVLLAAPGVAAAVLLGLMAATTFRVAQGVHWRAKAVFLAALFSGLAASIAFFVPGTISVNPLSLVLAGAFAGCAMILPGISGSTLLLLVGLYEPMIEAVASLHWPHLLPIIAGNAVALLLFTRVLRVGLEKHPNTIHAILVGLLFGSLVRLWPWRSSAQFAAGTPSWPGFDALWWVLLAGIMLGMVLPVVANKD